MAKFIVVDDFAVHPDGVKQSAINAGFSTWLPNKGEVGSSVYEGMSFIGEHAAMLYDLSDAVGEYVVPNTMFFRYTAPGMEKAYIHSDREMGEFTCVAYLSSHDEPYGTGFFKHKPTGLIEMPSFEEMEEMGILEQMKEDMVSRDPEVWELTDFVEGKYNRAVIFEAPLFHSRYPFDGLGEKPEDARMVWVSHFYMHGGIRRKV